MDSASQQKRNRDKRKARAAMDAAAVSGAAITYTDVLAAMESNTPAQGKYLTSILCEISDATRKKEGILLSAVVVSASGKRKGRPGRGFFDFAEGRGYDVESEQGFWTAEVEKVFSARAETPAD